MAKQIINVGQTANDKKGDSLRAAFTKVNANFTDLYSLGFKGWVFKTADYTASPGDRIIANTSSGPFNITLPANPIQGTFVEIADGFNFAINNLTLISEQPVEGFNEDIIINIQGLSLEFVYVDTTWQILTTLGVKGDKGDPGEGIVAGSNYNINLVADDSTVLVNGSNGGAVNLDGTVRGDIVPDQDSAYDLGSADKQFRSLYVSNNTIFIGGVPLSVNESGQLIVDGDLVSGAAGTVQPYLELTSTPFITQPVTLGTPVTVTAEPWGVNARFTVVIGVGPTVDSITITTAGTGYVVGQRYRIWSYNIGGPTDESSIDFTVATVGEAGELLTITDAAFVGSAANTPGTYTNRSIEYRPSVFDEIDAGLVLTRGRQQGIFNIAAEEEYDNDDYLSPLGTEWNSDGWGDLTGLSSRTYETWRAALNNQVGNNILDAELVMHDIANDKYYKFDFTQWGGSGGGFVYTRTLIEDPNYFRKLNYATANDVDVIEDDSTLQIGITRGLNGGIYNPFTEEGWDSDGSPDGTLWNADGWTDLTDIETRTYTTFNSAVGGNLGNNVLGLDLIMSVPSIEKYYAVKFLSWTQGIGGNTQGGGFSYTRREIDLTKLDEGIRFADGTVQKSAYIETNVVSTAPGERRIETASGYKQVSVTERVTTDYAGTLERTTDINFEIYVTRNAELDEVLLPIWNDDVNADFEISLDGGSTYRSAFLASIRETEYWFYYSNNDSPVPQVAGDTVDIRILTGGDSVVWWNKSELPGGASDFRGAIIDYHAYTGESTIIGTIHIVDDDGEEHISHQEVQSGSTDGENDDLWLVTSEGQIRYRRIDGESKTLKIHWTAKVFYGDETYD